MNGRPNSLAEVAARRLAGGDFGRLLSEFLDQFYQALASGDAQVMIAMEPATLADVREHALLGAAGEHLARRWKLSIPDWTNDPSRFLKRPYFTSPVEGLKALLIAESPLAFLSGDKNVCDWTKNNHPRQKSIIRSATTFALPEPACFCSGPSFTRSTATFAHS